LTTTVFNSSESVLHKPFASVETEHKMLLKIHGHLDSNYRPTQ